VGVQGGIGFFFDRIGEAIAADHDHRVEVVGFGTVHFALGRGKLYVRHGGIIGDT